MRLLPGLVPLNAAINLWRPVTTSGPLSFNYITAKEVLIASATVNWFTAASEHGVERKARNEIDFCPMTMMDKVTITTSSRYQ